MKKDTKCKRRRGVTRGQRTAPRGDRDAAETAPSVIRQLSRPQAEVRTNPCQWERPDLSMRSRSAGQFTADTVSREGCPVLLCASSAPTTESMRSSSATSWAPRRSPPHLSGTHSERLPPLRDRLIRGAVR